MGVGAKKGRENLCDVGGGACLVDWWGLGHGWVNCRVCQRGVTYRTLALYHLPSPSAVPVGIGKVSVCRVRAGDDGDGWGIRTTQRGLERA